MKDIEARARSFGVDIRRASMPNRLNLPRLVRYTLSDGLATRTWEGPETDARDAVARILDEMLGEGEVE